jgi:hypothetical protein
MCLLSRFHRIVFLYIGERESERDKHRSGRGIELARRKSEWSFKYLQGSASRRQLGETDDVAEVNCHAVKTLWGQEISLFQSVGHAPEMQITRVLITSRTIFGFLLK